MLARTFRSELFGADLGGPRRLIRRLKTSILRWDAKNQILRDIECKRFDDSDVSRLEAAEIAFQIAQSLIFNIPLQRNNLF